MTAVGSLERCDCCGAQRPAGDLFEPYRGALRCRDVAACGRRQLRAHDATILADEDLPAPPATGAPAGAACAVCGAPGPGLYERIPRSGQYMCRDRDGCRRRTTEYQYLTAWSDSSPDRLIDSADMRAAQAAAGAQIPPEPSPPDPAAIFVAEARRAAMGRRRER